MAEPDVTLVRHGETEWSRDGRHTGTTDVDLTARGRDQATATGARLAGQTFALVLVSPRLRARETCRLAGLADRAEIDADLAEWDYGQFEGKTSAEIEAIRPGWSLWTDGCPGGERPAEVASRADRIIARCRATTGATILFAHGHILRVIGARWVGLGPEGGRLLGLSTASVSVLGWEHHTPILRTWNLAPP